MSSRIDLKVLQIALEDILLALIQTVVDRDVVSRPCKRELVNARGPYRVGRSLQTCHPIHLRNRPSELRRDQVGLDEHLATHEPLEALLVGLWLHG